MPEGNQLDDQESRLLAALDQLRRENELLKRTNRDLEISLSTTAEHGDIIESQLQDSNQQLKIEVEQRKRTQATLHALLEVISKRKDDLEIVVQTIMEHGDVMDTQWAMKLSEMHRIVALDSLTQIANRRRFDEHLEYQWKQMGRERSPLSIIICDIDHFKQYNDAYGHLAGDDCLQKVARVLDHCVKRPGDLVARFGGEEFAVILPQTDDEGALSVAQRMQMGVADLKIPHFSSSISSYVTLSIGIASVIPAPQTLPTILLDEADQHLYLAKQGGRNRIVSGSGLSQTLN